MPDEPKPFDIRTNAEWQRLGLTAESAPRFQIDESEVPERFRHLIPYAERWGIDCDVRRGDYFDKQSASDINDFYQAVKPHWEALNAWIDEGKVAGAKLPFSFMLKAYCEAAPPLPPEKRMPIFRKKK
jgi:hypothetical protein